MILWYCRKKIAYFVIFIAPSLSCWFILSQFSVELVSNFSKQRFALQEMLRCVSCRLTDYFVVRSFAAIVAEIVDCVTQVGGAWREHNCFCIMTFARKVRPYTWENTIFVTKLCTQNNRCFTSQFVGLVAKAEGNFFIATTVTKCHATSLPFARHVTRCEVLCLFYDNLLNFFLMK